MKPKTIVLLAAFAITFSTAALAQQAQPSPGFPAQSADGFTALLNWLATATPETKDDFLDRASAVAQDLHSSEALAQTAFLRQLSREGRDERENVIKGYAAIADDQQSSAPYRATAAFRCAELRREEGGDMNATVLLGLAREYGGDTNIWVLRDQEWRNESVKAATGREFLRINESTLSYRVFAWIAGLTGISGASRFLVSLLILFLLVRALEIPFMVRLMSASDQKQETIAILSWLVVDLVAIYWAQVNAPAWQFIFDLDRTAFLWIPSLTSRDLALTVFEVVVGFIYLVGISSLTKRPFSKFLFLIFAVGTIAQYFSKVGASDLLTTWKSFGRFNGAYANLYWVVLFFSGFLLMAIVRAVASSRR